MTIRICCASRTISAGEAGYLEFSPWNFDPKETIKKQWAEWNYNRGKPHIEKSGKMSDNISYLAGRTGRSTTSCTRQFQDTGDRKRVGTDECPYFEDQDDQSIHCLRVIHWAGLG
ncbi:hypothetical protein JTB14_018917 [Gonioctena quinquepunctata]|nr:hypothetical protein JTB14_018917 [Gonioctena quinquepunctata]